MSNYIEFTNGPLKGAAIESDSSPGTRIKVTHCTGDACIEQYTYESIDGEPAKFQYVATKQFSDSGHVVGGLRTDQLIWN